MDLLMAIGFFIMFLVILGVLIYLIYDYIKYKKHVDETVEKMQRRLKWNTVRVQKGYNDNVDTLNNATSNILMNRQDLIDFDNGLKNFFRFSSNNIDVNNSIFDYIMNPDPNNDVYKMKLLKRVEAVSGMKIDATSSKNFQICSNNACIDMQIQDNKFRLTPRGTQNLEITAANAAGSTMANFDFANNSIYFGGTNASTSPLYLNNQDVIVDSSKFKFKAASGPDVPVKNLITSVSDKITGLRGTLQTINDAMYSSYSNVEFIAQYKFNNETINNAATNKLEVIIVPLYDVIFSGINNSINIYLPSTDILSWYTSSGTPSLQKTDSISTVAKISDDILGFEVTFTSSTSRLAKGSAFSFSYSKAGASLASMPITGVTIPVRTKIPATLDAAKASINNWITS